MWMVSAVVPLVAPKTGSGTGVPIRRPRSSHQRNVTVVKIVHHRQPAVVVSGSTVVAICHHRRPALVLDGGATVAPRSARAHGGENFPPPCPSQRSRKFCRTVPAPGAGERLRKFSGPVAPARFAPADGMVVPIRHHHGLPARGVRRRHSGGTVGVPLARWEEISSHRARGTPTVPPLWRRRTPRAGRPWWCRIGTTMPSAGANRAGATGPENFRSRSPAPGAGTVLQNLRDRWLGHGGGKFSPPWARADRGATVAPPSRTRAGRRWWQIATTVLPETTTAG